jgi:hypothetical protein
MRLAILINSATFGDILNSMTPKKSVFPTLY